MASKTSFLKFLANKRYQHDLVRQRTKLGTVNAMLRKLKMVQSILSLHVYHRSVKLVTKYQDFIHFIASHVSIVTKMIIRISL